MVNRNVCPIMSDQLQFNLKRNSSRISEVEEISTVMSILRQPTIHCSQMMICGMMIVFPSRKNHLVKLLNMFLLLLHHHRQSKHLLRRHLLRENQPILPVTRSTDMRALHLLINFLLHHKFLLPERKHHPRKVMIIYSMPP